MVPQYSLPMVVQKSVVYTIWSLKENYMKLLLAIILLAASLGCQESTMRKRFGDRAVILSDASGRKYVVKQHMIDTYTIEPLEETK